MSYEKAVEVVADVAATDAVWRPGETKRQAHERFATAAVDALIRADYIEGTPSTGEQEDVGHDR